MGVMEGIQETILVGSSLDVHALSSFTLGADKAYEFDDVKRVNVKRLCGVTQSASRE